jgi:ATP-binding cassette subfamily C (CFTR/MRP) protein 4
MSGESNLPRTAQRPPEVASESRLPRNTTLFKALNFELFVKPNKVVMTAGLVTLTCCVIYIAYINATAENRRDTYMALNERGELEKKHRTSRWE